MATVQSNERLFSRMKIKHYDFDPGDTNPNDIDWVDMRDYGGFAITFFRTVGTSNLDTFSIIANPESDGGGTDVTIKAHAVPSEPNLIGDQIFLEITAEMLADAGSTLRYVSASVEFATNSDEAVITYVRFDPRFPATGLTASIIA